MTDELTKNAWEIERDRQFNFWWSTEPFGYDHPDTKDGIKQLMDWARDATIANTLNEIEKQKAATEILLAALTRISNPLPFNRADKIALIGSVDGFTDIAKDALADYEKLIGGKE